MLREGFGALIVLAALGLLGHAVFSLQGRDYLGCVILVVTGLSLMRAGVELLRAARGE